MEPWWRPALGTVFAGRKVVIAGAVPAAWNHHVEQLRAAGADAIMVIATGGHGVGPGPDVPTLVVEPPEGLSMMDRIRFDVTTVSDPPPEVLAALDEFDPHSEAIACGGFLNEAPALAGRPFLAWRRPEWVRFEDKTVIDAFWDRAAIQRQPATVVPLREAAEAARGLDRGDGTVWAADSRDGFHGGASATRWVGDDGDAERVEAELTDRCDRVRVMPFLDGVSCSIHGLVDDTDVAVLRPVEMITLRRGRELVYAGCATFWDPPSEVRRVMREVARRAGALLRRELGFRGTFTIDGVACADGFWPTELNPRFGAGINVIARATGDVPILLLHDLIVAGRTPGVPLHELEDRLVEHADANREGGTWRATGGDVPRVDDRAASFTEDGWKWSADGEPAAATVSTGSGFVRCHFLPERTPVGPSVAARAAALWQFIEPEFGVGAGDLTAPTDPFAAPAG